MTELSSAFPEEANRYPDAAAPAGTVLQHASGRNGPTDPAETDQADHTEQADQAKRADQVGRAGQEHRSPSTGPISRWSLQAPGVDVFWPILAVVLAAFVIVVATVAHSSMAAVGVDTPRTDWAPLPTPTSDEAFVIVQVASFPSRDEAQAQAGKLSRSGENAQVLRSDQYAPLNKGWYVVYIGPFADTGKGRTQADAVTRQIKGSLVRVLHRR